MSTSRAIRIGVFLAALTSFTKYAVSGQDMKAIGTLVVCMYIDQVWFQFRE